MFGLDPGDFLGWQFQQSQFPGKHTTHMNHIFYEGCTSSILVMRLQSKRQLWPPESFLVPFFDLVRLSLYRSCPGGADAPTSSPDCTWSLLTTTLFKSHNIDFKLGEEVRNIAPNSPTLAEPSPP
jgi:hypothetical protein